ncbi:AAA family ATPase [Paucibacter sp. XJ19-41]|uniref:AAA family ATPase n=1 Tax=Paucibacter sp. XJ19-41 TaxID=2927824 RepID=UPI00234BCCD2|nr:AAA family ATPase [Paucibacter sp. XJ19-41]MDC6168161.1 AAA family ATPase [Paucibacter sp. XJ19-41]
MKFSLISAVQLPQHATSQAFLIPDHWDDWFDFDTRFNLVAFDEAGKRYACGSVKVGQIGLLGGREVKTSPPTRTPALAFDNSGSLSEDFFSVGQGDDYYETLNTMPAKARIEVLEGMRDCAYDLARYERHRRESVMTSSLMRYVTEENLRFRFHRLAHGNLILTRFHFQYEIPVQGDDPGPIIDFSVSPHSDPPTNVHVLIGRNGVGKSRSIQGLTAAALDLDLADVVRGTLRKIGPNAGEWAFSGLVHVAFSAFDSFAFPPVERQGGVKGTFVGLSDINFKPGDSQEKRLKAVLGEKFSESLEHCRTGLRAERWRRAVETLCSDPMFRDADILGLLDSGDDWREQALSLFKRLSSGHAIVLLTTTRLVELVDERTLVVLDEPEGHLHPPLLSAFIRAVSDLLIRRNGVAIIATHSPVVLQEVPASCVSILSRNGRYSSIDRPPVETFGEAVGRLTRDVFGLEVTYSGFHALVSAQVKSGKTFEEVLAHFDGQLGTEAILLARGLVAAEAAKTKAARG